MDASAEAYDKKLKELKSLTDPIIQRKLDKEVS